MNCPKCGRYAWEELDREINSLDSVCLSGHRVTLSQPLEPPEPRRKKQQMNSIERMK